MPLEDLIPTRASLLGRLKNTADNDSWREFFDTYWRLIYEVALKAGLSETEAEEAVQETIISVSRKMPTFEYDPAQGSFKGWLLNLTRWRIADQLRKRPLKPHLPLPTLDDPNPTSGIEDIPDAAGSSLETLWNEEWERNLVTVALERLKRKVKAKQFQVFDLHVMQKWPVKRVTTALGVSIGQVYLIKHRLSTLFKKELERLANQG